MMAQPPALRPMLCAALIAAGVGVGLAEPAAPAALAPAAVADECARLFRRLGDDHWKVREEASNRLRVLGKAALPSMAAEYRRTRDPEVRCRLQEVCRELYWQSFAGFLGISMQAAPRIEAVTGGVLISEVLPGTAAQKAGLQREDIIVEFNGQDMRGIRTQEDLQVFSRAVQSRGAGIPTRIVVLREGERRVVTASLGQLPEDQRRTRMESLDPFDLSLFDEWWKNQVGAAPTPKSPASGPPS
jgi:C-terminal processing protease CtpA/Prc